MSFSNLSKFLVFIAIILALSCEPKPFTRPTEERLPPVTCYRLGNFGCRVNGKVFLGHTIKSLVYNESVPGKPGYFSLYATDDDLGLELRIDLLNQVNDTGWYRLGPLDFDSDTARIVGITRRIAGNPDRYLEYFCAGNMYGWLHFHCFSNSQAKASGTFEFDAVNMAPPYDTIRVTDGRFDMVMGR